MDAAPITTPAHRNSSSYAAVLSSCSSYSGLSVSKGLCIGMDDCGLLGVSPGFLSLRESDDGRMKTKQVEYLLLPDDYMEDLDSPTTEGGETTEFGSSHDSADSCVDFSDASVVNSARILRESSEEHDDIFEDVSRLPDLVDLGNTEMLTPFATFSDDSSKSAMNNIMGGIGEEEEVNGSVLIQMVRSGYRAPFHVEPKAPARAPVVPQRQQQQPSFVPRQGSNTIESTNAVANAAKLPKAQPGKAAASRVPSQPSASPKRGGASTGVSKPSIPRNRSKVQALPADASKSLALKAAAAAGMPCCRNCGTTNTPLWRGGPEGPKTLCNACGVRYMKTNKKPRERRA